jgi:hypothetical protein
MIASAAIRALASTSHVAHLGSIRVFATGRPRPRALMKFCKAPETDKRSEHRLASAPHHLIDLEGLTKHAELVIYTGIPTTKFGYTLVDRALHALRLGNFAPLFRAAFIRDNCLVDIDRESLARAGLPPGAILDFTRHVFSEPFQQQVHKMLKQSRNFSDDDSNLAPMNDDDIKRADMVTIERIRGETWVWPLDIDVEMDASRQQMRSTRSPFAEPMPSFAPLTERLESDAGWGK